MAARESEKFATEIRLFKDQADKAIRDLERKERQLEEFQEKLLQVQSGKNTVHEDLLFKFEKQRRDLEEKHRDDLSSLEIKLNNKESDIYKMEQLLLKLNHSVDQAKDG